LFRVDLKHSLEEAVHAETERHPSTRDALGALVTEGKTKKIYQVTGDSDLVTVISKDDITAGDGAKHDIISDKGRLANRTTCNVFRLLKACGLPVGFEKQDSTNSFIAPKCLMLP
jgi:phosphoribosylaminoimidazole-succinocarboxamide synthase